MKCTYAGILEHANSSVFFLMYLFFYIGEKSGYIYVYIYTLISCQGPGDLEISLISPLTREGSKIILGYPQSIPETNKDKLPNDQSQEVQRYWWGNNQSPCRMATL